MANGSPHGSGRIALFLPSLEGGGAERVFVELANWFDAAGLHVDLALAHARGPYLDEVATGVRVIELGGGRVARALPAMIRHLRKARPDAMLSALDHANIVALLAARFARCGTRCVISMRSVPSAVYREAPFLRRLVLPPLMRAAYPRADHVVANSNAVASDLIARFGIERRRVSVIYNPIDTEGIARLSAAGPDDPWCERDSAPIVLGVGSLTKLKDFGTLIRAFAILRGRRRARLVILGEGGERATLERLVTQLRLHEDVYLPGFAKNPFAWMQRAQLLVSSSVTEGCPNAVMQALACGTPVVCTDGDGGSREILDHGRWGRLVPVRDEVALAHAMIASLDEPPRRDLRTRAEAFSIDEIAKSFLAVLLPGVLLSSEAATRSCAES